MGIFRILGYSGTKKLIHSLGILLSVVTAGFGCFAIYIQKRYTLDPRAGDSNSLLFMTNLFSASIAFVILLFFIGAKKLRLSGVKQMVINKNVFNSLFTTLNSNFNALLSIQLVAMMDIAVITPITSALGFVSVALVSPLVKERLDKYTLLATLVAVLSVILPILLY